ncbi:MAG: hypothetical protein WC911_10980 [Thermoleophilia bacterium]
MSQILTRRELLGKIGQGMIGQAGMDGDPSAVVYPWIPRAVLEALEPAGE